MIKNYYSSVLAATALCAASAAHADQVIADDLIVQGSICVGFDCNNGESFGFDTLRLKENNLRIHFEDTSTSASFPSNDWRLIANSSANGGDNFFKIEDSTAGRVVFQVDAGARNNALYVDSQGDVGIGTGAPVTDLHIIVGNTPTLRLDQDGSSGFSPQIWDVAGNEAGFFVRDATHGSALPFRILPDADSNALVIAADNDVGINTLSPNAALHVRRTNGTAKILVEETQAGFSTQFDIINNGAPRMSFVNSSSTNEEWHIGLTDPDDDFIIRHESTGGGAGNVFRLDSAGALTISGAITTGGTTCGGGCDLVFDESYDLPSISEHASLMWENGYLPNVGPTVEGAPFNLTDKVGRMLNELEHAHIYIAQLEERLLVLENKK